MSARARKALAKADPKMGALIERIGELDLETRLARRAEERPADAYGALLRAIVGQQLSTKAARTIYLRVLDLFGGTTPSPAQLLEASEEDLRGAGHHRHLGGAVAGGIVGDPDARRREGATHRPHRLPHPVRLVAGRDHDAQVLLGVWRHARLLCPPMADIEAHITGNVWKIEVKVGDEVSDGDTVAILESMKMEIPVESEDDGVVKEIRCEEGQSVSEGDVLVVLE